ncbi:MAG: CheR family methyltransferase [Thermovirgaceae bacterium]
MVQMRPASAGGGFEHTKALSGILKLLAERRKVDFSGFRPSVVEREVRHRMELCRCKEAAEYRNFLENDPCEIDGLLDSLTVGVSEFFRDPLVFSILSKIAIPLILEKKASKGDYLLRVWSAGCSSGEEAYSIAILIAEALTRRPEPFRFLVFGTDIDEKDLVLAREGRYPSERLERVPLGLVKKYFHEENRFYRMKEAFREVTGFSRHDLLADDPVTPAESVYGAFDMILCRNVLMYMLPKIQERTFSRLDKALKRGGFFVLGEAEEIPAQQATWYDTVCRDCKVFHKT